MDLTTNTLAALDWDFVLEALASLARTRPGSEAARVLEPLDTAGDVTRIYDAVDELSALRAEGRFMVTSSSDETPLSALIRKHGLAPVAEYHARHLSAHEALRAGRTPDPQTTPYAGRPPYG